MEIFCHPKKTIVQKEGVESLLAKVLSSSLFAKLNPNAQKSYKILQKLSPKHSAHGVAQSPYPIYSHRKVYLSK